MTPPLHSSFGNRCREFLQNHFLVKAREINSRYAVPRIQRKSVSIILSLLLVYLVVLITIIFFKFCTLIV